MRRRGVFSILFLVAFLSWCDDGGDGPGDGDGDTDADGAGDGDGDTDADSDVEVIDPECVVGDESDAPPACRSAAPPGAFEPDIQWTYTAADEPNSTVMPLVANLTDDNGDGRIDLCDVPDVVVVAYDLSVGHVHLLDGATGQLHRRFDEGVASTVTPALGDIDGDMVPDIVTVNEDARGESGYLIALDAQGSVLWRSSWLWEGAYAASAALADLDNDGDVEILASNAVLDHEGNLLWTAAEAAPMWSATTAADLDGDGDLEVVLGHAAYHHDGTQYYFNRETAPGFPQIADLDADGHPEVLVTNERGITILEHDGTTKIADQRPTRDPANFTNWWRPATIHDFDGDGMAEIAMSSLNHYSVFEADGRIVWTATVADLSGVAAGTAFDFLGDGSAEAMYADETTMYIFGPSGEVLLSIPRTSGTLTEYPVVADIDNDGSAEIVVVSDPYHGSAPSPLVQAIRDREDRWIQARRIWNQHTYHVTNIREDGVVPQYEAPSHARLNTFRTNSQIEGGTICEPPLY